MSHAILVNAANSLFERSASDGDMIIFIHIQPSSAFVRMFSDIFYS